MIRYTFTSDTRNIYEAFNLSEADANSPNKILETLETFSKGIINETLERHTFNLRQQEDGESFDDFMTDVKTLSKNCKFCHTCYNGLLRDRLVGGIASNSTKNKLLSEKDLTLEKTIDICRASEKAVEGMQLLSKKKSDVEYNGEEISWVNKNVRSGGSYSNSKKRNIQQRSGKRDFASCKFCLRQHQFGRDICPAWKKTCRTCGLLNHFAGSSVCQNQVIKNEGHKFWNRGIILGECGRESRV